MDQKNKQTNPPTKKQNKQTKKQLNTSDQARK